MVSIRAPERTLGRPLLTQSVEQQQFCSAFSQTARVLFGDFIYLMSMSSALPALALPETGSAKGCTLHLGNEVLADQSLPHTMRIADMGMTIPSKLLRLKIVRLALHGHPSKSGNGR